MQLDYEMKPGKEEDEDAVGREYWYEVPDCLKAHAHTYQFFQKEQRWYCRPFFFLYGEATASYHLHPSQCTGFNVLYQFETNLRKAVLQ
jgi:hypothetical protein